MLANAASTEALFRGSATMSPSSSSTLAMPSSARFFLATSSIAGELSTASTRPTLGGDPGGDETRASADVGHLHIAGRAGDGSYLLDDALVVVGEAHGVPVARHPLEELLHVLGFHDQLPSRRP